MTRTKSSGKPPARRKATKAKTAADAASEPKQTTTRARKSPSRALSADDEPLEIEEAAESGTYAPVEEYVPPMMAPATLAQPARRRAVLFDVENTSRTQDIEKVLAHLALDFTRGGVEFMAVGNWRVIGHEPARILAAKGAHLIHSAPSTGVRDWSDLRIAVAAGVWIATAQPGDVLEIVSDDQAFEAVGDVAAGRGILFRRVSYRRLAGLAAAAPLPSEQSASTGGGERRGRRGRRRSGRRGDGGRGQGAQTMGHHAQASQHHAPSRREEPAAADEGSGVQTAPLDELLDVLHALLARAPQGITLDNLANALKARGFRRRPGSPRLITRLKLIKDIVIDRAGNIRLADGANGTLGGPVRIIHVDEPVSALAIEPPDVDDEGDDVGDDLGDEGEASTEGAAEAAPAEGGAQNGRRRRRRRGGRRRRGRRGGSGSPVEAAAAPVAAPLS